MVNDVIEALNKNGLGDYNKEIEEFIQTLIQNHKTSKKNESKRTDIEVEDDIKKDIVEKNEKEKIV